MSDIEALEARLAHNKQQLQTLIQLVASKPDDMPCEKNAARILACMGIMPSDDSMEGVPPSPGRSDSRPKG
ncbi:hypothetical protein [Aeromonas rivipollensis]|uniref:hypothetical protein n=1 Tax=Aeromonas rivipollensis TaxID=948519 RepID=UPI003D1B7E31